jgi:hypothetical protein
MEYDGWRNYNTKKFCHENDTVNDVNIKMITQNYSMKKLWHKIITGTAPNRHIMTVVPIKTFWYNFCYLKIDCSF